MLATLDEQHTVFNPGNVKGGIMNEFPIVSGLAELPEKALVDERTLASIFKVSTRTIARWVQSNTLPVPARFGAKRVWIAGRILTFIEARVAAHLN